MVNYAVICAEFCRAERTLNPPLIGVKSFIGLRCSVSAIVTCHCLLRCREGPAEVQRGCCGLPRWKGICRCLLGCRGDWRCLLRGRGGCRRLPRCRGICCCLLGCRGDWQLTLSVVVLCPHCICTGLSYYMTALVWSQPEGCGCLIGRSGSGQKRSGSAILPDSKRPIYVQIRTFCDKEWRKTGYDKNEKFLDISEWRICLLQLWDGSSPGIMWRIRLFRYSKGFSDRFSISVW